MPIWLSIILKVISIIGFVYSMGTVTMIICMNPWNTDAEVVDKNFWAGWLTKTAKALAIIAIGVAIWVFL